MNKQIKTCLVVSYGPVPTPQYQTVEGGGMRAWGLAEGLRSHGVDVTVGVNSSFPQKLQQHEGVKLLNWQLDADFVQVLNSFDTVIISYCMGDPSTFVAENLDEKVQLILDAYVPIYIEVSARESENTKDEYVNYMSDIAKHNQTLRRGDYFLYANDAQKLLYTGVLSALGIINPYSYRNNRLIKTPFGIHRTKLVTTINPYKALKIRSDDFVVLWFGGIYPWFRIDEYLDTIKQCVDQPNIKFVFVGGKNPFNPNPDFSRQYDRAVQFANQEGYTDKNVFFVDWVDFNERANWFTHASVIVSINQPGEENIYSWRTRVMDYVWGEAVTISNGGDPLSEELIAAGAALRLNDLDASELTKTIKLLVSRKIIVTKARKALQIIKQYYFWDVITTDLYKVVSQHELPYSKEQPLLQLIEASRDTPIASVSPSGLRKISRLPAKIYRKVRQKGVRRSANLAASIVKNQFKQQVVNRSADRQFIFISHPINNTGGPIVLLQMIEEYVQKYGANRVRVIAPGIEEEQSAYLRKLGIKVEQAVFGADFRFIRLQLALKPDDFVLMNTVAIYDTYRDFILTWLRLGRLKHAYWFIHEDIAQLPVIHAGFLEPKGLTQTKDFVDRKLLSLLFPSKRTAAEYRELLKITDTNVINLRVEVDESYKKSRTKVDFDSFNFLLSGTATDGRKGQFLAISAFYRFMMEYYEKSPDNYRPFTLHLVAIGDDYVSSQIRWTGESLLGNHIRIYPPLPKADALKITAKCNAVICSSLNETFGLYIAEGMLMGHIVLRNGSAGIDEQLVEGENGYEIDHTDTAQFAAVIEKVLNKKQSNRELLEMSRASQRIINEFSKHTYISQIENI